MEGVTYSWNCKTVDVYPTQDSLSNVVYNVHWRLTGTKDEKSATSIGTEAISSDNIDPDTFVAFDDLTNTIITGWVESSMGTERVQEIKDSINAQLQELITPTTETKTIEE